MGKLLMIHIMHELCLKLGKVVNWLLSRNNKNFSLVFPFNFPTFSHSHNLYTYMRIIIFYPPSNQSAFKSMYFRCSQGFASTIRHHYIDDQLLEEMTFQTNGAQFCLNQELFTCSTDVATQRNDYYKKIMPWHANGISTINTEKHLAIANIQNEFRHLV